MSNQNGRPLSLSRSATAAKIMMPITAAAMSRGSVTPRRMKPISTAGQKNRNAMTVACPSSNALGQSAVFGTEALARLG
jgi:hypothetical protein